jgi:hypothetical protein
VPTKNIAGKTFGLLTARSLDHTIPRDDAHPRRAPRYYWRCDCACGRQTYVRSDRLLSGKTISCGCVREQTRRAPNQERKAISAAFGLIRKAIASDPSNRTQIHAPARKLGADRAHCLPSGTYTALFDIQQGVCAICKAPPPAGEPLHLDHDHATNEVRGLLCSGCNTGLGYLIENKTGLVRGTNKPHRK